MPEFIMCAYCGRSIDPEGAWDYDPGYPFCGSYCWEQWIMEATDDD